MRMKKEGVRELERGITYQKLRNLNISVETLPLKKEMLLQEQGKSARFL
jgi:hypothetical protein